MPPFLRVPSCRVKASRDDATVPARFQPVVAAPRIRCHRVCASPNNPRSSGSHRPHDFLATGNYPLSTIHCSAAHPVPPSPARNSETCYTARSSPNTTGLDPNARHVHNCPPTIPRPPAMSTCSKMNVRILAQANFAPGIAGNNPKCADLPSAAPPAHTVMTHAMRLMPAPPASGFVSCHEKHSAVAVLRNSCTQNDIFCAFSGQTPTRNADIRILLRESMSISCHENTKKFLKVRLIGLEQAIRYPIDTLSIPDFRRIRSHFTTQYDTLGPILERIGRILAPMCGFTDKETEPATDFDPDFGTRGRGGP